MESGFDSSPELGKRVRATFFSPSDLPRLIAPRTPWLDVLLISTVVALISVASMPDETFLRPLEEAVTRRGEPVEIVSSPEVIARWGRLMAMLATLWTHPVIAFVLAGIGFTLFRTLTRGSTSYRELLALASHAMLIPALGSAVAIVVRLASGAERGAGAWYRADPSAPLLLRALLAVDPFIIWMLIVFAIGLHGFDARVTRARSGALLVGGYLALVLGSTALLRPEARQTGMLEEPVSGVVYRASAAVDLRQ